MSHQLPATGIQVVDPAQWSPSPEELRWQLANGLLTTEGAGDERVYYFRCLRSGGCCHTNLCGHGVYAEDVKICRYLVAEGQLPNDSLLYKCTYPSPTLDDSERRIGRGCCAPWSASRQAIIDAAMRGYVAVADLIPATNL